MMMIFVHDFYDVVGETLSLNSSGNKLSHYLVTLSLIAKFFPIKLSLYLWSSGN